MKFITLQRPFLLLSKWFEFKLYNGISISAFIQRADLLEVLGPDNLILMEII